LYGVDVQSCQREGSIVMVENSVGGESFLALPSTVEIHTQQNIAEYI
jgi:hypothetical protein